MTPIDEVVKFAPSLTIEQLEKHIQERAEAVDALHAEQAKLIPILDSKWQDRISQTSGPANLRQQVRS